MTMKLTRETTLSELFQEAKEVNGTYTSPDNFDASIDELRSELDKVLELTFSAWFELRVMPIEYLRGIPRIRYISNKGGNDGGKA